MTEVLDLPEKDPTGRPDVPKAFQDAFKIKPIRPTTGLKEGTIEVPTEESLFSRARRALSGVAEKLDTNKENIRPKNKPF